MSDSFIVEDHAEGKKLVLKSSWDDNVGQFMRQNGIRWLELNTVKGWPDKDVEFLPSILGLERLDLIPWGLFEMSSVGELTNLVRLNIAVSWRGTIDFSGLSRLEVCFVECGRGAETILQCARLKQLHLLGYKPHPNHSFMPLVNLEVLKLSNSTLIALPDLGNPERLSTLWLRLCPQFEVLTSLCQCKNLKELLLEACRKVTAVDELVCLHKLRKLSVSDNRDIASLRPIEQLRELEELYFVGSTRIVDGDLAPLLRHPRLKRVLFDGRRHYSHKLADFKSAAEG